MDSIVWDNHACLPLDPGDERFLPGIERYRRAGVTVVGINVGFGDQSIEQHIRMLGHFRAWFQARPATYLMIDTAEDIARVKESGRLGVFFDIEGANAIGDQISLIELYYALGVRWMLMAYNRNNRVGGGCLDEDTGLTAFGRDVVAEMNRLGMVPCCSHTGKRTALEVIALSKTPVIFSHSNPRAVFDHPRNIDDETIRACAQRGGVVGINGVGLFLGHNDVRSVTLARHIDYVVQLVGSDHVGIGLDYVFDQEELIRYLRSDPGLFGEDAALAGSRGCAMAEPEQIPEIADELGRLGYTRPDVQKIMGLNFLRIASQVWNPSAGRKSP